MKTIFHTLIFMLKNTFIINIKTFLLKLIKKQNKYYNFFLIDLFRNLLII